MKTERDESSVPRFEDLVFEGRNKEYGAYTIREKYNSTVMWAILAGVLLAGSLVIGPYVNAKIKPPVKTIDSGTIIFTADPDIIPEDNKIQEQKQPEQKPIKETFTEPNIVDTIPEGEPSDMQTIDDLLENITDDSLITVDVENKREELDKDLLNEIEAPAIAVDEDIRFGDGDVNEFRKWIKDNVKYPIPAVENNIQGRVFVEFVVEKDGSVSNVKIIKSDDPVFDAEAIRVISSSPKWIPAKRQGRPVRKLVTFPIIFKLNQN